MPAHDRQPGDADPAVADAAAEVTTQATADDLDRRDQRLSATLRFGVTAAVALTLFVLTYLLFVTTRIGQEIENLALQGAAFRSEGERIAGLERLGPISVASFALALGIVIGVSVLQGRPRIGVVVAGLMGSSVVLVEILKAVLARPALVEGPAWLLRNSFPSGTAAVAVATAIGAMLISPDRLRWVVVPVAVLGASVVGEAVQTTGWHRLSDTLGSAFIVVAVMTAGVAALAAVGEVERTIRGRIDRRIRTGLIVVSGVVVTVAAVVLLIASAFPLLTSQTGGRRVFLQTAFPLVGIGATALVLIAVAWVIEPYTLGRRRAIETPEAATAVPPD